MGKGRTLQKMTNGYYIVTAIKPAKELKTRDEDYIAAGVINWATQVSFDPLQIGVSVQIDSHLNETIDYSEGFTLHILSEKQQELIEKFSGDSNITDKAINGLPYTLQDGLIVFKDALGYLECELADSVRSGDHTFHIGKVMKGEVMEDLSPLTTLQRPSEYQGEG